MEVSYSAVAEWLTINIKTVEKGGVCLTGRLQYATNLQY